MDFVHLQDIYFGESINCVMDVTEFCQFCLSKEHPQLEDDRLLRYCAMQSGSPASVFPGNHLFSIALLFHIFLVLLNSLIFSFVFLYSAVHPLFCLSSSQSSPSPIGPKLLPYPYLNPLFIQGLLIALMMPSSSKDTEITNVFCFICCVKGASVSLVICTCIQFSLKINCMQAW